jgi:hypothetical protein
VSEAEAKPVPAPALPTVEEEVIEEDLA